MTLRQNRNRLRLKNGAGKQLKMNSQHDCFPLSGLINCINESLRYTTEYRIEFNTIDSVQG